MRSQGWRADVSGRIVGHAAWSAALLRALDFEARVER